MRFFEYPRLPYEYFHSHKEKVAALTRLIMGTMETIRSGPGQIYLNGRVDNKSQMGVLGYLRAKHGFSFTARLFFIDQAILPEAQTKGTLIHISRK